MKIPTTLLLFLSLQNLLAQPQASRWQIVNDNEIVWTFANSKLPHSDHIELSGIMSSVVLNYDVDEQNNLHVNRTMVFPTFRTNPYANHATHASLMYSFDDHVLPRFFINNKVWKADIINGRYLKSLVEYDQRLKINGRFVYEAKVSFEQDKKQHDLHIKHRIFPSARLPMMVELFTFINTGTTPISVSMDGLAESISIGKPVALNTPLFIHVQAINEGTKTIQPRDSVSTGVVYYASTSKDDEPKIDLLEEERLRKNHIDQIASSLQLETPNTTLNTLFSFSKRRTTESIYKLKCGLLHSPGGLSYYAAIWANDQAEYANPFFGFLGNAEGIQSAMNSFGLFARFMNPAFKPIPSSIVSEGDDSWGGAGDRGDMAMIAYGASRFALAYAQPDSARKLLPLIDWCLEFCKRKINSDGVVSSDSDELEGRFPAGDANLSTSSLYYDALISTGYLYQSLGLDKTETQVYFDRAAALKKNIEKFFGASVEGFATYRYYKGNNVLRSWICIPLCMDIFERKSGTIDALFSPRLWTADGLASQAGDSTFWDRTTLYGFRGILAAGETEKAMQYLIPYSNRRLVGEHVPYPVEAYPEGNQRHLAAESALYCRIFTEGLFGIRPVGFRAFICKPRLPKNWNTMKLKNIVAFQNKFDLTVTRKNGKLEIVISSENKVRFSKWIDEGQEIKIKL